MNSASSDLYPREPATIIGGPVLSDWSVHIIGIDYRPPKDQEPNWFWRKMQFLAFGFRWTRCK